MADGKSTSSYADFDDAGHIRRTLAGQRDAFDVLVRQYAGMVHAIAMAGLDHDSDTADELTQEVFLRAWLQLEKLSQPEAFPAWLARITRNLAADWKRHERRRSGLIQMIPLDDKQVPEVPADGFTPYGAAAEREEAVQVMDALRKLRTEDQELLLLHHAEGLSQSEIARRLGVNPSTIMRKLDKAARRLRTLFHEEPPLALRRRNHEKLVRRTGAILAGAWAMSAAQRTSLADVAAQSLSVSPVLSASPFFTRGGILMSAAAVITIVAALSIGNLVQSNRPGTARTNGGVARIRAFEDMRPAKELAQRHLPFAMSDRSATAPEGLRDSRVADGLTTEALSLGTTNAASTASVEKTESEKWPGTVTGRVVDGSGNPMEEVTVRFAAHTYPTPSPNGSQMQQANARNAISQPVQQIGMKDTDESGNFTLKFNTSGTAVLYIDHEPYVRIVHKVSLPTENLRIELKTEEGATATGRVVNLDNGEPVPDADVAISMYEQADHWSGDELGTQTLTILGGYERFKADGNGRYSIDRMPAVEVSLMAWSDQVGPSVPEKLVIPENPVLAAGTTTTLPDIFVFPGYTLRGYVRDWHTSQPIAGASVGPSSKAGFLIGKNPEAAVTDENGYYEVKGMRPLAGKPRNGEPAMISFPPLSAAKKGYIDRMYMPRVAGDFDPKSLVMENDFRLSAKK